MENAEGGISIRIESLEWYGRETLIVRLGTRNVIIHSSN